MANIKDVARLAGVGLGTVSRYLNGHNVTENNRQKIEKAIHELEFIVNPIARSMITKRSMTVAVVLPRLSNIFGMKIIESVEKYLESFGYSIIVCDCGGDAEKELERLKFCVEKMVDGIVLISSNTEAADVLQVVRDTPVVLVDRTFSDNRFDSITVENFNSAYMAVHQCISNGHKKMAILAGPQYISTARERLDGVMRALKDHKTTIEKDMIYGCRFETRDGYHAIKNALGKKPDMIFASNYELTIGAIKALNEAKMIIGKDISLIGFDNLELVDVYPYSMTVIAQPVEEIGFEAAKCLHQRIENVDMPVKNIVLRNEIVRT